MPRGGGGSVAWARHADANTENRPARRLGVRRDIPTGAYPARQADQATKASASQPQPWNEAAASGAADTIGGAG
jgi:hypothetical protein